MTLEEIKMQYAKERSRNGWPLIMLQDTFNCKQMDEVAERYAQSKTQELQEQNAELVDILSRIVERQFDSKYSLQSLNSAISEAKEILTKYNHLKSNING